MREGERYERARTLCAELRANIVKCHLKNSQSGVGARLQKETRASRNLWDLEHARPWRGGKLWIPEVFRSFLFLSMSLPPFLSFFRLSAALYLYLEVLRQIKCGYVLAVGNARARAMWFLFFSHPRVSALSGFFLFQQSLERWVSVCMRAIFGFRRPRVLPFSGFLCHCR